MTMEKSRREVGVQGAVQLRNYIIAMCGSKEKDKRKREREREIKRIQCMRARNITLLTKWDNATVCDKLGATHGKAMHIHETTVSVGLALLLSLAAISPRSHVA